MSRITHRRGMTLIEIGVAVVILASMCALAYGAIVMQVKTRNQGRALLERYHTARVTLERIRRELSTAFLSLHQNQDKETQTLFDGQADQIIFTTSAHRPMQRNAQQSDQIEVEYRMDREDDHGVIVRRVKHHIDSSPGKGGFEQVVAVGIERLQLEYYDLGKEDWTDDWSVIIDDAEEKRIALKAMRSVADTMKAKIDAQNELAGAVADVALDKVADEEQAEVLENVFLPSRMRIRITLEGIDEDDDREYVLETQVEIPMHEPLWY
jgi:type II secretory pathway pseudopilin PulG